MKAKKILSVLTILILLITLTAVFTACGGHTHSYVHHPAVSEICTTDGSIEYWSCSDCDKLFSDDQCTELTGSTVATATGHGYSTDWSSDLTHHWHECTACGDEQDNAEHTFENNKCTICDTVLPTIQGLKYVFNHEDESYTLIGIEPSSKDIYIYKYTLDI